MTWILRKGRFTFTTVEGRAIGRRQEYRFGDRRSTYSGVAREP
jgi:hypothetical protein